VRYYLRSQLTRGCIAQSCDYSAHCTSLNLEVPLSVRFNSTIARCRNRTKWPARIIKQIKLDRHEGYFLVTQIFYRTGNA
jgi:hypothetical protein